MAVAAVGADMAEGVMGGVLVGMVGGGGVTEGVSQAGVVVRPQARLMMVNHLLLTDLKAAGRTLVAQELPGVGEAGMGVGAGVGVELELLQQLKLLK